MTRHLLMLLTLTLAGCPLGTNCTLMYAPDGVRLDLEPATWPAGTYTLVADGVACTFDLPGAEITECEPELHLEFDETQTGLAALDLWERTPDVLAVELYRDEVLLDGGEVAPAYEEDEVNGKGCGVRSYGEASMELDPS